MIILRPLCPEDAPSMLRWMNDPDTVRYLGYGFLRRRSPEDVMELIRMRLDGDLSGECFAIADADSGKYLGQCELMLPDLRAKKAEIALVLLPEARGKGYAAQALKQLTDYAFTRGGFEKLHLKCALSNTRALKLYEKAGFVREGLLRRDLLIDGRPEDTVLMALFKDGSLPPQ